MMDGHRVRCLMCHTEHYAEDVQPTISPKVVIALCPKCVRARPSRALVDDAPPYVPPPVPEEDEDHVQRVYREWRGTPDGAAVVARIRRRALEIKARGFRRYGIQALAEVVRFDHALRVGPDAAGYKVNNSHLSRLARDLMDEEPELRGFFETRELRTEEEG